MARDEFARRLFPCWIMLSDKPFPAEPLLPDGCVRTLPW